jgi:hypothetical protein
MKNYIMNKFIISISIPFFIFSSPDDESDVTGLQNTRNERTILVMKSHGSNNRSRLDDSKINF